jgi:D-3-phosphoglycerate dehydrogenase
MRPPNAKPPAARKSSRLFKVDGALLTIASVELKCTNREMIATLLILVTGQYEKRVRSDFRAAGPNASVKKRLSYLPFALFIFSITDCMPELPLVLITEDCDAAPLAWLKERARVVIAKPSSREFDAVLPDAVGMMVRTYTKVNAALLARCPRLHVVGRGGVGLENIDVAACRARGVEVVYTPDANTLAVADFVIGFALQLLRPWALFRDRAYEPAEFKRVRDTQRGAQLNELTFGILGMGRVGRRVGHLAAIGFGARVIYNDLLDVRHDLAFPATAVDKPALFREADVVTLHVDMRPGNEHLVGAPELALLKPTAILINTSRGEVLDAGALAATIRGGKIAGAALDVFDPEPPPNDYPLLGFDNVLLSPHMAARTHSAVENMSWVVRDIVEVLNARPPKHPAP